MRCAGCKGDLDGCQDMLTCHFSHRGFPLGATRAVPCLTRYHPGCFRLREPFYTRLIKEGGLFLTPAMAAMMPIFICECCTVRKVLERELHLNHRDCGLLALERMRMLDTIHNWAPTTLSNYKGRIRQIQRFGETFRVPILATPLLESPPISEGISLMWAQQHYSLQPRQRERFKELAADDNGRVSFGSVRHIRSAASLHQAWIKMVRNPGRVILDPSDKPIVVEGCRATDDLSYKLMNTGMNRRLGSKPRQAAPLLDKHVRWMDCHFDMCYYKVIKKKNKEGAREIATVALCNLLAWLGWLLGGKTFGLDWDGIELTLPSNGAALDLPRGVGALMLRLLEQTKSNRTHAADLPIAFQTYSGLSPGKWILRLHRAFAADTMDPSWWQADKRPLLAHADGSRWTSSYFRQTYLLPLLHQQRMNRDKYLLQFKCLADAFWSMHCYRSGGRSHVSVERPLCWRKATNEEVNEHG